MTFSALQFSRPLLLLSFNIVSNSLVILLSLILSSSQLPSSLLLSIILFFSLLKVYIANASAVSVCALKSLLYREHSHILIVEAFSNSPFSDKTSSLVSHSYLTIFPDYKAEFIAFCLSKLL